MTSKTLAVILKQLCGSIIHETDLFCPEMHQTFATDVGDAVIYSQLSAECRIKTRIVKAKNLFRFFSKVKNVFFLLTLLRF